MTRVSKKILLKTTINQTDDWHIGRFSILKSHLERCGHQVDARDRQSGSSDDPDLTGLADSDYDQLWLFAVDDVDALNDSDVLAVRRFRERGGGLLATRDHQDLGASLSRLEGVGSAHHFHSCNPESDPARHCVDDRVTDYISWPNYFTGANGDYQRVQAPAPEHPLVQREDGTLLQFLPSHPHEGVVSVPPDIQEDAEIVLVSTSQATGRTFCSAVAFSSRRSGASALGNAVAQSTFHHFVDPNLDPRYPMPSFVSERSGDGILRNPEALSDSLRYIENLATWL